MIIEVIMVTVNFFRSWSRRFEIITYVSKFHELAREKIFSFKLKWHFFTLRLTEKDAI